MSRQILEFLFSGRQQEVTVSATSLFILGLGGVFLTLSSTFISIFQVIGRSDLPVKLMLPGCAVKLIFNVFTISVPAININGAAVSTVIMYAAVALGGYFALEKCHRDRFSHYQKNGCSPERRGRMRCRITDCVWLCPGKRQCCDGSVFADSFGRCSLYNFTDNLQRDQS